MASPPQATAAAIASLLAAPGVSAPSYPVLGDALARFHAAVLAEPRALPECVGAVERALVHAQNKLAVVVFVSMMLQTPFQAWAAVRAALSRPSFSWCFATMLDACDVPTRVQIASYVYSWAPYQILSLDVLTRALNPLFISTPPPPPPPLPVPEHLNLVADLIAPPRRKAQQSKKNQTLLRAKVSEPTQKFSRAWFDADWATNAREKPSCPYVKFQGFEGLQEDEDFAKKFMPTSQSPRMNMVPKDPTQPARCALSGEPFETVYDYDNEEWCYANAVQPRGPGTPIFHVSAFAVWHHEQQENATALPNSKRANLVA